MIQRSIYFLLWDKIRNNDNPGTRPKTLIFCLKSNKSYWLIVSSDKLKKMNFKIKLTHWFLSKIYKIFRFYIANKS